MSCHIEFKIFTDKLLPISLRVIKQKIPHSENEAKQNQYEFPDASSVNELFKGFRENYGFCELRISKS